MGFIHGLFSMVYSWGSFDVFLDVGVDIDVGINSDVEVNSNVEVFLDGSDYNKQKMKILRNLIQFPNQYNLSRSISYTTIYNDSYVLNSFKLQITIPEM